MAPYKALYGKKCRSPIGWFDIGETRLIVSDMVQQAVDKIKLIRERLFAAQSKVAYELDLPSDLEVVHLVFHVSMLHKYADDPPRIFPVDDIQVNEELSYEERPIAILDRQVKRLRTKDVASVKMLW
ncbi:uncharacterized protein LOC129903630 [Solanum dulcamara]|uniref:uncharacterized protein LOC129903630 n=1 Tax=Solanum dulcamara TaxID=45834 RepID=UPI0024862143|nr:uncharacterized protein LOC129903630 [Solanum dulcamara]